MRKIKKEGKTKLALEKEKKQELDEAVEYLRQVELPESQGGGQKFVHDTRKEEKKEEKKKEDEVKSYLEIRRQARFTYREKLATYGYNKMMELGIFDWEFYCIPTDGTSIMVFGKGFKTQEGILFIVKSPKDNVYIRGINLTHDPEYDVNAVNILLTQVENTIDSEKGLLLSDNKDTSSTLKKTKGGVWIPN